MNREIRERLNQLWRKLQKWERDGYEVSSLRSELEEFERQEGIVRRSKAPMVALMILLILAVGGGITVVGINYHNRQIAIREKLRGEEETRRKAEEEARKLREKVRQDSIRLAERLKEEREAKKRAMREVNQIYDEARIRYIMADMSLGGPVSYYRGYPEDLNAVEAVRRWSNGVRVTNANQFQRRIVEGKSWQIVYKGTKRTIDGMDVILTTY